MNQKPHSFQALLGNLAVPIITAPVITLKEKYREGKLTCCWCSEGKVIVVKERRQQSTWADHLAASCHGQLCLITFPTWTMSSGWLRQVHFLYYLCYRHISIFRMDPKLLFSEKAQGRAAHRCCVRPQLAALPCLCSRKSISYCSQAFTAVVSLFWIFTRVKRKGLKDPFFKHCFLLVNFTNSVTLTAANAA